MSKRAKRAVTAGCIISHFVIRHGRGDFLRRARGHSHKTSGIDVNYYVLARLVDDGARGWGGLITSTSFIRASGAGTCMAAGFVLAQDHRTRRDRPSDAGFGFGFVRACICTARLRPD